MPYISQEDRDELTCAGGPRSAGELNYVITRLIDGFLARNGVYPSYEQINTVVGVLECAKMELYRRIAAPYEDQKCDINGDVYTIT